LRIGGVGISRLVSSTWTRRVVVALALVCAGAQIAPGTALFASALTLGLHASEHAHSVSLSADEGHVHLVLSHDQAGTEILADTHHRGDRALSTSGRDHVLHVSDDGAATAGPRRAGVAPAPPVATSLAVLAAPSSLWVRSLLLEPCARSSDRLRTVVLQL
jgi:hypothetical protein